jgi:pimeloyl-ACP methyl ester carboxylesterase
LLLGCGVAPAARCVQLYRASVDSSGVSYVAIETYEGSKIPIVVIHGLNNDIFSPEIKSLSDALAQEPACVPYFQVFSLEYDTTQAIDANGSAFAQALAKAFPSGGFVLIGHSMGGLAARSALELHGRDAAGTDLMSRCLLLITLGSPHHGTPFANASWLRDAERRYPLLSLFDAAVQRYSGLNLSAPGVKDMAWDDFDGETPDSAKSDASRYLGILNAAFDTLSDETSRKYRFIGGYSDTWPSSLNAIFSNPQSKEVQYRTLGFVLAKEMPQDPSDERYVVSDGMVPLSSALFLKPASPGDPDESVGKTTNQDQTLPQGYYQVEIDPAAIEARKPAVRDAEAVEGCLHYSYPENPAVYQKIRELLLLPEACGEDLNSDGQTTILDAQIGLRILVGLRAPSAAELLAADCDRDGKLSLEEVVRILKKAVGL